MNIKLVLTSLLLVLSSSNLPLLCLNNNMCNLSSLPYQCGDRCSATKHVITCVKFCRICCLKCKCVPKGGKPHQKRVKCPCYSNMKNSKGLPKCP
ncbi:hypothetical protein ACOSP7_013352 [Xanthoceras sorbifolium]